MKNKRIFYFIPIFVLFLLFDFKCKAENSSAQDFVKARERMVKIQIEARGITDKNVLSAMKKVERHRFVPPEYRNQAYGDFPLPIGMGQTISQPYIVALMTEVLNLDSTKKVPI